MVEAGRPAILASSVGVQPPMWHRTISSRSRGARRASASTRSTARSESSWSTSSIAANRRGDHDDRRAGPGRWRRPCATPTRQRRRGPRPLGAAPGRRPPRRHSSVISVDPVNVNTDRHRRACVARYVSATRSLSRSLTAASCPTAVQGPEHRLAFHSAAWAAEPFVRDVGGTRHHARARQDAEAVDANVDQLSVAQPGSGLDRPRDATSTPPDVRPAGMARPWWAPAPSRGRRVRRAS